MSDTVKRPDLRELFAEEAHKAWSGWMEYLFSKSEANDPGEVIIPAWAAERWRRQAATPYSELPEDEKKNDREEAARYLQYLPDYDRDIKALSTALNTAIEERDEMYKSYNAMVLIPKLRAATADNERLQSLLRELRVHLREGSIERLRIDAALEDTHE